MDTDAPGEFGLAEAVFRCQSGAAGVGSDACLLVIHDHGRFRIGYQLVSVSSCSKLFGCEVGGRETEGIGVEFTDAAIDQIAEISFMMNEQTENIGARRLHTVLEKLLEEISFNIPEMTENIVIDEEYVKEKFQETIHAEDLDRYIL